MNNVDILEEYLDKQDRKYVSEYRLMILKAIETLIAENKELKEKNKKIDEINFRVNKNLMETAEKLESEKEKNSKAREFIKENSHEFNCKRDGLIELEFDYNTNATDLIDILDGNW